VCRANNIKVNSDGFENIINEAMSSLIEDCEYDFTSENDNNDNNEVMCQ